MSGMLTGNIKNNMETQCREKEMSQKKMTRCTLDKCKNTNVKKQVSFDQPITGVCPL